MSTSLIRLLGRARRMPPMPAQALLPDPVAFSRSLTQDSFAHEPGFGPAISVWHRHSVIVKAVDSLRAYPHVYARGTAVVDLRTIADEELWELNRAGIRGLRLTKMASTDAYDPRLPIDEITHAAARIRVLPAWKLQLFVSGKAWDGELGRTCQSCCEWLPNR